MYEMDRSNGKIYRYVCREQCKWKINSKGSKISIKTITIILDNATSCMGKAFNI